MDKLISVNELKEWIENWFKLQDYYKYGDAPTLRDKKVSRKKIDLDELYDILERMPDERRVKTNFEWLVENDRLLQFLKDIVLTECADGVKFERVFTKKWGIEIEWGETVWNIFAKWLVSPHEEKNIFDVEEVHNNCTVQILRNSATGEESIGWWENGKTNC